MRCAVPTPTPCNFAARIIPMPSRREAARAVSTSVGTLGPAERLALAARPRHARHNALADHRSLELAEHAKHPKHGAAGRRRSVEVLPQEKQIDALGAQFAKKGHKVGKTAREPIDAPSHDKIDVTACHRLTQAIEAGALVTTLRARHAFGAELSHDAPALLLGNRQKLAALVLDGLVAGRNP